MTPNASSASRLWLLISQPFKDEKPMSPKLPAKGTVTVDIHTRPKLPADGHTPLPDTVPRVDFGLPVTTNPRIPPKGTATQENAEFDAITPAPTVTASEQPSVPAAAPAAAQRPLEHYWLASATQLPAPDALGFRTFKGRQYVDVPGGGIVHITADPDTGLYRAKLPSELQASGPVLVRDPESKLWHRVDDLESTTYPLTATRLEAFRTHLDFTGVEPGSDGLYRHDGKLYVVIENRTYQALHDLEASSPQVPVMRIVRAEDSVALDDRNAYVATRSGRSEPIVFDGQNGWSGRAIVGAGGMRRTTPDNPSLLPLADLMQALHTHVEKIEQAIALTNRLRSDGRAAEGTEGEKSAIVQLEVSLLRQLTGLENMVNFYLNHRDSHLHHRGKKIYLAELHAHQKKRVELYTDLLTATQRRKYLDIGSYTDFFEIHRATATYLANRLVVMQKRQDIADDILNRSRTSAPELANLGYDPTEIHEFTAYWVQAKSFLLTDTPVDHNFFPVNLALSFIETTLALRNIDNIPEDARVAVLSNLIEQCAMIKDFYAHLTLPPGPAHVTSRGEIIDAIQAFENTLEQQIARYHRDRESTSALPAQDQPIDFDFVPAQTRSGPQPMPRRMFRARHHGVYKVSVGQPRRTATGEELIDVIDINQSAKVLRTYEQREGEWRRVRPVQNTALPELITQATQRLDQFDSHLSEARQDERAKRNATNIVEFLGGKAEALDDLARQLEHAPNPTGNNIAPLVQRLREHSHLLRNEGEDIRIRLYKDKAFLSADRLAYLISQGHIGAVKTHSRLARGKGKEKHFLDIYSLNDSHTGEPLWHAHFHYDKKDSPALNFKEKGAHLKTLEQSGSGISSQRRDEQADREHIAIWRHAIDGRTAQRIFDLSE
jgi:hypothetical protein